ncbi:MAG: F0F1 ATP synthase subunit delta [Oscillospiraceae bacterium]|nr:F0F1 ATP synthase subunit delta [Oscillospiraceae bacterium]
MRNILKGFLNPLAEEYILPDADSIEIDGLAPPAEGAGGGDAGEAESGGVFRLDSFDEEPSPPPPQPPAEEEIEAPAEPAGEEAPSQESGGGPVQYAQLQAELILKQAREEADRLLADARAAAKREQEEIRAGARDEGYRVGYAEGTAKAVEDAVRDREAVAARLEKDVQDYLEKADMAREEMILQTREELLDLCIAVAEKVVRVSLRSSSEVIVRMIQTATERLKRQEWVHIYISGCDSRQLAQISPTLTTALGALSQHIKVVPMGDGEDGTCIVETPDEIIDASVSTQMSNIRDILHDQLGGI